MKTKFDEMFDRLPSNIKDSDVLRLESKKILAALLELLLHSEARNTGVIYVGNSRLRKISGVGSDLLLGGIQQLEDYELITRVKGSVRKVQTEKGQASEYRINFKKMKEPIIEKTFDDLFNQFLEGTESSETPISTTITTAITTTMSTSNTTPIETTNTTATTTPITTPIETTNTTEITEEDFEVLRNDVIEETHSRTKGLKCYQVDTVKIELYRWIRQKYSKNAHRLVNIANTELEKIKKELMASMSMT